MRSAETSVGAPSGNLDRSFHMEDSSLSVGTKKEKPATLIAPHSQHCLKLTCDNSVRLY